MGKRGRFAIKNKVLALFLALLLSLSLIYLVLANSAGAQETADKMDNGNIAASEIGLAHINYEERMKYVQGALLSTDKRPLQVFEKSVNGEIYALSVELVEPITPQGTHLRVDGGDVYLPSGGTSYAGGWLVRHRGNVKDTNGIIHSNINAFFVGKDGECGLADHYECINGSLHWLYCDSTDYGVVEECDSCEENECLKKGTFARWERIKAYRENVMGVNG